MYIFLLHKSCTISENRLLWDLPLLLGKSRILMAKISEEHAGPSMGPHKTCPSILHRIRATFSDNGSALQRLYKFFGLVF